MKTSYDGNGNVQTQTDGLSGITTYGYDPLNRKTSVTDPLGRVTSFAYDGIGMISSVDPLNQITTYAYDYGDRLIGVSYSDGVTPGVTYGYDNDDQRQTMVDGTGTNSYLVDSLHRMYQSTNGAGQTVSYGYDLKGQMTSITYPGNLTVNRPYDAAGRLKSVSDWLGHTTALTPDPDGNQQSQVYPNGLTATRSFDAAGAMTGASHAPTGNPGAPLFNFSYPLRDGNEQVKTATTSGSAIAADSHTYTYTNLNQVKNVDGTAYTNDAADNLTGLTSGQTQPYDVANEVSGPSNFDPRGDRTSQSSLGTPARFGYDQANRLTALNPTTVLGVIGTDNALYSKQGSQGVVALGGSLIAAPAVVHVPTSTTTAPVPVYIGVGSDHRLYVRNTTASWQDLVPGGVVGCYDNPAATVTGTGPYTLTVACRGGDNALYFWQSSITSGTLPSVTTAYTGLGGVTTAGPAVGVVNGTLTFVVVGTDSQLYSRTVADGYTLTAASSCTGHPALATLGSVAYLACHWTDGTLRYATNSTSWTAFQSAGGAIVDGPGIAATSAGVAMYVQGTNGHAFHTIVSPTGPGNTTSTAFIDDGLSIVHGVGAVGSSGSDVAYSYDGDGLRQSKTPRGGTVNPYTWDVAEGMPQLISETTPQGRALYIYGPGGQPLEQVIGTTVLYYHQDQLGSTRALTNSSGTAVATYTYDTYGNQTAHTGSADTPFKFAGQYTDSETGFQYLRARYYDPATAQFISRDPIVATTRSAYGYVGGNPLNATDPTGMLASGLDPSDPNYCFALLQMMRSTNLELARRYQVQAMFLSMSDLGDPETLIRYMGHKTQFYEKQINLRKLIDEWHDSPCGGSGPPRGVSDFAWKLDPQDELELATQGWGSMNIVGGLVGIGAAIMALPWLVLSGTMKYAPA